MTSLREQALEAIRAAERKARELVDSAMKERRFDEASAILAIVEQLSRVDPEGVAGPGRVQGIRPTPQATLGVGPGDGGYPRFFRETDQLLKVGRSRSTGDLYEHRAPRPVLEAVARRAVALYAESQGPIKAEALSDLRRHEDGTKLPGYQLYLCLGWLKHEGLLRRHGRKGYTIKSPDTFTEDIDRAWDSLADRLAQEEGGA
jgi:hypothetical protein